MVRGFYFHCHREVAGFLKPPAWQYPGCRNLRCEKCPRKKVGRYSKKLVCRECHVEMTEGGLLMVKRE